MKTRHKKHGLSKRCDCPRRTWPKCRHGRWLNFKPRGGPAYRISLDKYADKHIDRKSDAEDLAASIRTAIKAGKFGQPTPRAEMTLAQLVIVYLERYVEVERAATADDFRSGLKVICGTPLPCPTGGAAPFGDWRLTDIVTDTIERYREARRATGTGLGGTNRSLSRLRAVYNWAVRTGYVERTPFKRGTEAVVRLSRETPRNRRLDADQDEATKLLTSCGPHLRALVEAALETGMRKGELLSLQWQQVVGMTIDGNTIAWAPRSELVLTAAKTKTRRDRRIPISTRLKAILEMRRFDPDGKPHSPDAYVFGNAIGQRVQNIKRAWATAVLKAHGEQAILTDTMNLTADCRAKLDAIDLHFHDLRREAGSRWLEGGVPLHTVRDWLGHTSIAQTSVYLAGTMRTQHDARRQYEDRLAALAAAATAPADATESDEQRCATEVETEGRKRPQAAESRDKKPNETTGDRETAIM